MDYFISSELFEPVCAEEYYREALARVPTPLAYYYRPSAPPEHLRPEFPDGWRTYFCPQTLFKFHPGFDPSLAEILRRDRSGRLLLIDIGGDYAHRLHHRLHGKYPDVSDRILFVKSMPREQLLAFMAHCDVVIDTWPFCGGNTSYEAFAVGVPVVTLPGDYLSGRLTMGYYRYMGFNECVANSPEEYVTLASRLAADPEYRHWVRNEVRQRSEVLYEDGAVVRAFARFFEGAHRKALG
jgi:predicted O-linked N-acetylglucosamine transferase (SPINDLY family)